MLCLCKQYRHHMCLEVSAKDFGGVSHDGLAVAEEYFNLYMTVIAFQLDGVCTN